MYLKAMGDCFNSEKICVLVFVPKPNGVQEERRKSRLARRRIRRRFRRAAEAHLHCGESRQSAKSGHRLRNFSARQRHAAHSQQNVVRTWRFCSETRVLIGDGSGSRENNPGRVFTRASSTERVHCHWYTWLVLSCLSTLHSLFSADFFLGPDIALARR